MARDRPDFVLAPGSSRRDYGDQPDQDVKVGAHAATAVPEKLASFRSRRHNLRLNKLESLADICSKSAASNPLKPMASHCIRCIQLPVSYLPNASANQPNVAQKFGKIAGDDDQATIAEAISQPHSIRYPAWRDEIASSLRSSQ